MGEEIDLSNSTGMEPVMRSQTLEPGQELMNLQ
jgi:hypothetical protein